MENLKMHSPDIAEENIEKLAALFPGCITESTDDKGNIKKAIDFDLLRQELSTSIVEGPQERYRLDWPGKREALLTANAPIAKTLRPCQEESVDFDTTENLFIEGENLDALKLLQETYLGKVKMIYIDPPYNTGRDFVYDDDFAESTDEFLRRSNQKDEDGNRLVANPESNGRFHSDWLSMMYSRLRLARNLLKDDGVIFISIDDCEYSNLIFVCNTIFSRENYIGTFIWKSRQTKDSRKFTKVSTDHEYIVCYSKAIQNAALLGVEIDSTKYKNPDDDPRGPWASIDLTVQETKESRPNHYFPIIDPDTNIAYEANPKRVWSKSKDVISKMIEDGRILFPANGQGRPREKKYLFDLKTNKTGFSTCLDSKEVGYTTNGTKDFAALFEEKIFTFPKPVKLLKTIFDQVVKNNELVLDFFAGSASTAHAIMQLNAGDGGKRKFIMVQLPEVCDEKTEAFKAGYKTIAEIGKERIRRAGKKIKEENGAAQDLDTGFRVLKIDSSNMADIYYTPDTVVQTELFQSTDNIKDDRSSEDLLFQVLLDWGVDLTLPIKKETIEGHEVFFVDGNALAACFNKNGEITEDFCKRLAGRQPLRVVFRDAGFKDDSAKINVDQIFKLMSPQTDVKTI